MPEILGLSEEIDGVRAEQLQHAVQKTVVQAQKLVEKADHDDGREEVRRVGYHLNGLAVLVAHQMGEADGQKNRDGEARDEVVQADEKRVAENLPEFHVGCETLNLIEADPRAIYDARADVVGFERKGDAVNGNVVEDEHVDDGNGQEQI